MSPAVEPLHIADADAWYDSHTRNHDANGNGLADDRGNCLDTVAAAFGDRSAIGTMPTAKAAFGHVTNLHAGDMNPPHGAVCWYDTPLGDVTYTRGPTGLQRATDQPSWGVIGTCSIPQRLATLKASHPDYPVKYLGWSDNLLGLPIDITASTAALPTTTTTERERIDMMTPKGLFRQASTKGQGAVFEQYVDETGVKVRKIATPEWNVRKAHEAGQVVELSDADFTAAVHQ